MNSLLISSMFLRIGRYKCVPLYNMPFAFSNRAKSPNALLGPIMQSSVPPTIQVRTTSERKIKIFSF